MVSWGTVQGGVMWCIIFMLLYHPSLQTVSFFLCSTTGLSIGVMNVRRTVPKNVWPQHNFYSYIREQGKAVDGNVAGSHEVWARLHKTPVTITGIRTCTRNLSELHYVVHLGISLK